MATEEELGTDLGGTVDDLDANLSFVSGRRALLQALADRYSTPKGSLWYAPEYGDDLRRFIGAAVDPRVIESAAESEGLEDERVQDISATVAESADQLLLTSTITLSINVTDADGPFEFTLAVSAVSAKIITGSTT